MIADKGWNSTLDPDTHARHGLSQEPDHDLGFHVQEGKRAAFFFRRWETTVQGGGDWGLERTMGTNRDEA